jgi:SpoIID/LytB domain protein
MAVTLQSGALEAVNVVDVEKYLRDVVPAEMPALWPVRALQVQAVASRSYAWFGLKHPKASWFDVDGDTRDQAYGGMAAEAGRSTQAVQATAGEVVVGKKRHPIFAQYASSDGGWTAAGSQPYLPAKPDPYDGAIPSDAHAWSTTISAKSLQSAYPSIGALENLTITRRDGNGVWGGRVLGLTLSGSNGSVDLSGTAFEAGFGLRSVWFRPVPVPGVPRGLSGHAKGRTITVDWKRPHSVKGAARVTGYRVVVTPDRLRRTLPANARQVSFGKLAGGAHTVRVAALSSAGRSQPVSVVVKTGHQ